jgi:CRISPR system Cascade subunit CasE
LAERSEQHFGFCADDAFLQIENYERVKHPKGSKHNQDTAVAEFYGRAKMSLLDITGVLTVTDASKFHETLLHGIGHGKAFGCGLLMVRRV